MWGLGVGVLGMGVALIATIDMVKRERQAGERMHATLESLRDSLRAGSGGSRGPGSTVGAHGGIEGISEAEIAALRDQGLADPVSDIKTDLARHPELIPVAGTPGGTMGFYAYDRIWILNGRWAYADFEDGHIGGSMLLEYWVEGGRIRWTRLAIIGP